MGVGVERWRRTRPLFRSSRLVDTPDETVVESWGNIVTRILRSHILFPTRHEMKFGEQSPTEALGLRNLLLSLADFPL